MEEIMKKSESEMRKTLKKLEELGKKIIKTHGYTKEAEEIKLLEELMREQLGHENSRYSAG